LTAKSTKVKHFKTPANKLREKQPSKTRNQQVVFLLLFENTSFSKGLKSNNLGLKLFDFG